ncbi:hypothetical protein GWI33_009623 [Rhynchophorus ferrugineus]|uniref:Uncharacterized protein n=1 Tax=Rhynchophorus ferrugineus TaxID=354439 RepID=A0A834IC02_RHYFE|nr:hypothetical protein GWI33_009623 [Rhynchophorus ferrugineus]
MDPILGTDFLSYYEIQMDVTKSKRKNSKTCVISIMEREAAFSKIIFKFPNVIRPLKDCENTHTVHHIDAREPPTPARTRRLAPHKLNCLREETKTLENEGIITQSSWSESSIWSNPVHLVEKKDGS